MMMNPRDVDQNDFPVDGNLQQKALFLLNYAVLAPSSHNTQPWQFKLKENTIQVFADTSRALPVSDVYNRELVISCGAAMGNFEVAANFFELECTFSILPDERNSSHLANITLKEGHTTTTNDRRLFSAITERSTSRKSFTPKELPKSLSVFLEKEAIKSNIELHLVTNQQLRNDIADLIATADQLQFDDPDFRTELSKWIRTSHSQQHDGISAKANWQPDMLTKVNAMIIRRFDVGDGVAAQDKEIAQNSPILAVIATETEEPAQWIATGRFLSHLLLELTSSGISVGYLNQAIELVKTRIQLRKKAEVSGYPQLLLRLGKAEFEAPSARRPLDEVVSLRLEH